MKNAKKSIFPLNINEIHPHPQNPRKDIGDVSELIESIKKNGIMQNLTVIPGHWDESGNFIDTEYTLIIGHRRYAAAKAAGIETVPCRLIEGMDEKEQLSTMLEENMQRADLTIWEQANGFQLMLDLGETEEGLAEKTGFSKSTIRHRLNIAKLDQKEIKKKEKDSNFQLTLLDLYELEKVSDINERNRILKNARTSNDIRWQANQQAQREKIAERYAKLKGLCIEEGIKEAPEKVKGERFSDKWEEIQSFDLDSNKIKEIKINKSVIKGINDKCLLVMWYGSRAAIIKAAEKKTKKETKEERERKQRDQDRKELNAKIKAMLLRKKEFIKEILEGKLEADKSVEDLKREMWDIFIENGVYVSRSTLRKFFANKDEWNMKDEEKAEADEKIKGLSVLDEMLIILNEHIDGNKELMGWNNEIYQPRADHMRKGFEILIHWGWCFEGEEESIIDGSCELYQKGATK